METKDKFRNFCTYMECIKFFLKEGIHEEKTDRRIRKAIYKATRENQYRLDETGTLFYRAPNAKVWRKIITSEEEKQNILFSCHAAPFAGHSGVNATTEKITHHFYWKGVKEEVQDYIRRCDVCQKSQKIKKIAPRLVSVQPVEPLYMVGMDFFGPLPKTSNGHKYILTLIDYATKWVECYPLKEKSGACVAGKIQNFISRYGVPTKLLSDQNTDFLHHMNSTLAENLGIEKMVTSAYVSQTNGMDERTKRMLKMKISKLCNEKQNDWDDRLEAVGFSLRTRKQGSTTFAPVDLTCKQESHLPDESPGNEESKYSASEQCIEEKPKESEEEKQNVSNSCVTEDVKPSTEESPCKNSKRKHEVMAEEAYEVMKSLEQQYKNRDEYQHFGDLIACKLRNLSTQNAKNTVQNLIQNILYEAEQGHYDNPSVHVPR